jgi:hypothetical protein
MLLGYVWGVNLGAVLVSILKDVGYPPEHPGKTWLQANVILSHNDESAVIKVKEHNALDEPAKEHTVRMTDIVETLYSTISQVA